MKNVVILAFLMSFISCVSDETEPVAIPVLEKEKKVLFEFYTDKDYNTPQFDTYFVNLKVGITILQKSTRQEEKILEETTGWIAFKDIPQAHDKIIFEKLVHVDIHKYTVVYWYAHQVRIGETIQMRAKTESLEDLEEEKLIAINF
jgi:hypothetical protein